MPSLKQIIDKNDTRSGMAFHITIQFLIVLSLITFSVETLPNLTASARRWLRYVEVVTVAIFTIEYLLRLFVADRKLRYVFSFFGILDLLAILPFYVSAGIDLRSLRAFRLLRLIRIFKMARYSKAVRRFHRALLIAKEEIVLFMFVASVLIYLAAVGIYYFENPAQPDKFSSVFDSLWWSVITLTTVGYGDVYPITTGGKIFTVIMLGVGLGIIAVPAGLVASALSKARAMEDEDET